MRLTWRDGLATLFVSAAALLYGLWWTGTGLSGTSVRLLGAVVFGLGWAACTSDAAEMSVVYGVGAAPRHVPRAYAVTTTLVGLVVLAAGVTTLVSANRASLATLVVGMVVLWLLATVRHATARAGKDDHAPRTPLGTAA